jgi:hypothetical protein
VSSHKSGLVNWETVTGTLRPPWPLHLEAERTLGGDLLVSWLRRRAGCTRRGAADTPLGKEREAIPCRHQSLGARSWEIYDPWYASGAALQAGNRAVRAQAAVEVAQLGTHAPSRGAALFPVEALDIAS